MPNKSPADQVLAVIDGMPGKYSNEDVTRKKSEPERMIEGSGLKPGMTGFW